MDTQDINQNKYNPRMQKLKQADAAVRAQQQQEQMLSYQQPHSMRQDKNASNVFNHLVDDPSTRAKLATPQQVLQNYQPPAQVYSGE